MTRKTRIPLQTRVGSVALAIMTMAVLIAVAAGTALLEMPVGTASQARRTKKGRTKKASREPEEVSDEQNWQLATTDEKLRRLFAVGFTSAEVAVTTASSLRTIEDRRRKLRQAGDKAPSRNAKLDAGIDALFSIYSLLHSYTIETTNIRAWLTGRSMYLEEQRPATLLSAGEFETIREAALAYAKSETPRDFLAARDPLPRIMEDAEV